MPSQTPGSWCVVAAYVIPECGLRKLPTALVPLKLAAGKTYKDEVKLKEITEAAYISFLRNLGKLSGTLYCAATEMSYSTGTDLESHRDEQARRIVAHIDGMRYEEGKQSYRQLSAQVRGLSGQLYIQLVCQVEVIAQVVDRGVLYYVQRRPQSLGRFKWHIDQKNTEKTQYEEALEKTAPPLLQSRSLEEPSIQLTGADYSAMSHYIYDESDAPNYLNDTYGLNVEVVGAFNIGKILRSDLKFVDSSKSEGVQVADLLVAGIRRALRGEFRNNDLVAQLLGSIMVQAPRGGQVPSLISLSTSAVVSGAAERCVRLFNTHAREMLT